MSLTYDVRLILNSYYISITINNSIHHCQIQPIELSLSVGRRYILFNPTPNIFSASGPSLLQRPKIVAAHRILANPALLAANEPIQFEH